MARKRMIDPSFWTDEKVARLTPTGRLTFIALWTLAEDSGVGRGDPRLLKSLIFPYDDIAPDVFQQTMSEIADSKLIRLYEVDGQQYYKVVNFLKYQKINRPTPAVLPDIGEKTASVTHGGLTEDSVSPHGVFSEDSRPIKENTAEDNITLKEGEEKGVYGSRRNVALTQGEYLDLCETFGREQIDGLIEQMSLYIAAKGVCYQDHDAAIRRWASRNTSGGTAGGLGEYEKRAIAQLTEDAL